MSFIHRPSVPSPTAKLLGFDQRNQCNFTRQQWLKKKLNQSLPPPPPTKTTRQNNSNNRKLSAGANFSVTKQ